MKKFKFLLAFFAFTISTISCNKLENLPKKEESDRTSHKLEFSTFDNPFVLFDSIGRLHNSGLQYNLDNLPNNYLDMDSSEASNYIDIIESNTYSYILNTCDLDQFNITFDLLSEISNQTLFDY